MPSTMPHEVLVDRALITDLLHAYCDHVDVCDIEATVELFTEDGVFDFGNGVRFQGRAQLRSLLTDRLGDWTATNHYSSNVRFLRYDDAGSAAIVSYIYAYHESPDENRAMHLWGRYLDELVREDDGWRIRVRALRVAGVTLSPSEQLPERFERSPRASVPGH